MTTITEWTFKNVRNNNEDYTIFKLVANGEEQVFKIDNLRHFVETADDAANDSGL